ncbi:pentatricopeptide repeat-containing protein At2g22410, mitochondrial-like [Magnolia sinica]|uniref:pentatricopeptide repeat-containing protein At2g22410, mitochondrial-like n=1 Tax=Magnolia sinica TaxID=86752 RepID=UPI00265858DF|nr:pentatricopeptide repeat-containing protein At2g22410, mitochondrial-like [Magnolia sinica]
MLQPLIHPISLSLLLSLPNVLSPKTKIHLHSLLPISSSPAPKPSWNSNTNLIITNPVLSIMESCNSMSQLKQIQAHMTRTGLMAHRFPASRVLAFCALSEFGDLNHARLVFAQIHVPNIYMWNTMIRGYAKSKHPKMGFSLFRRMLQDQIEMDRRTFVFALKTCEQFREIIEGESLHCLIFKMGFYSDLLVRNGLMHFYVKHGLLVSARHLFDGSSERDAVSWTTMIDGYAQNNLPDEALKFFYLMVSGNVKPNEVTMITVLSACSQLGILSLGRSIHEYINTNGVNQSVNLLNSLVDMYMKCGCLDIAREVFGTMEVKDVFSWTSMINGCAKCGDLSLARRYFDEMPKRNVVSWNAMIAGYSQTNQPKEAIDIFHQMKASGLGPTESTLVSVLSACAQLGCLDLGMWINHYYIDQKRVKCSVILMNALVDMYAKCGSINTATSLFDEMLERDLVSWNSMIAAYAVHGYGEKALVLFEQMKSEGVMPDDITFIGVLSACSHSGLVIKGREYFINMRNVFGVEPKVEHYACMIDLFGRLGLLEEAYELITSMPMEPDEAGWGALLNACRMHGNVELGKLVADKLLDLDPDDSGIYVLLSNMYATRNRWEDVKMVRRMMRGRGVKKTPGCSSIEVDGRFHKFLVADKSHPLSREIYLILDGMFLELKLEGYVPNTSQLMGLKQVSDDPILTRRQMISHG